MRIGLYVAVALIWLNVGATCIPLVDNSKRQPEAGETLVIVILAPTTAATVAQGASVPIEWTAANLTGEPATVSLVVESRTDLTRTTVVEGVELTKTGESGNYAWDTHGFSGPYAIIARIETLTMANEDTVAAQITVDPVATFAFTAPLADAEFALGESPVQPLTISWIAGDNDATVEIGLDTDTDHIHVSTSDETDAGKQVVIALKNAPNPAAADKIAWDGTDKDGKEVPTGTYYLYALVGDSVNPDVIVDAPARITVVKPVTPKDTTPKGLAITKPSENTTLLTKDAVPSLTIEYQVDETTDALADLKIDTDDDHTNGNEITIKSQVFVKGGTTPDPFAWSGKDSAGTTVADGIYRLYVAVSTGSGTPATADAAGLVYCRTTANQPLIALQKPGSTQSVNAGSYVSIEWRDNAPLEETDSTGQLKTSSQEVQASEKAMVRITVDDDATPNQGETGSGAEKEILSGREAAGDGVNDTFSWQVPSSMQPGTYWVFAYIGRTGATPDNISIAPGRIIIKDPNTP